MFVDESIISISAGNGGNGAASFRREKYIPKGGPDGGDGGKGGDIYIATKDNLDTLDFYSSHKIFKAKNGENGMRKKMFGKGGEDLYLYVPKGTLIYELVNDKPELLKDMTSSSDNFLVANGGKGGLGNVHFKSSTNQAPREFTYGEKGKSMQIKFELKLIADIGLVGFPNSGKSTLTNILTNNNSKVGDYPFTTLIPQLGALNKMHGIIIADIPGILENASKGKGLGLQFLRHISRTKMIIFVLDASTNPYADYEILCNEINQYDKSILDKKCIVLINKCDLVNNARIESIKSDFNKISPIFISAKNKTNIDKLTKKIKSILSLDN